MKDNTEPLDLDAEFAAQEKRRINNRLAKQRSRRKQGRRVSITIELPPEAYVELCRLGDMSRKGGGQAFWRRALIQGALFVHNTGQANNHKARLADLPALASEIARMNDRK